MYQITLILDNELISKPNLWPIFVDFYLMSTFIIFWINACTHSH